MINSMSKGAVQYVKGREILDSRGNPTVEAVLETDRGFFSASVPAGASRGQYEALELRDGGERYQGKGVRQAVANIDEISGKIKGIMPEEQKKVDQIMIDLDGHKNKSRLGTNAILAVSLALARAGAANKGLFLYEHIRDLMPETKESFSLPRPCFNIINGGLHAGNDLDIQEFMIVPQLGSFRDNYRAGQEIYQSLKEQLKKDFGPGAINLGDEGGFAPPLEKTKAALDIIMTAIKRAGYQGKAEIGLDCASSEFFDKDGYHLEGQSMERKTLLDFYQELVKEYPILFLEDPFQENDWLGFSQLKQAIGDDVLVIGDDLTVTNPERIKEARDKDSCQGIIIKPNQIGTLTEAITAVCLAKSFNWATIVSHRSGETTDSFIADLAVGVSAPFIKSGAPARGERLAKYNQLLRIEETL